ncbi:15-hydroxyprostaglandin dehydrogenase [NAD(+)] [Beauveria bassiana]|uniref:15-hydroxyprostaglandin dehydrogenase [NAD(+)] n=1 Tax=Beauveria bassiana TaxID=176275 RepID=A0A2N6NIB1_BEABA|nr:15-hydroxyprostaglandin dehydrogenase [NAD(+)] [Beauveria bassiana]
MAPFSVQGKTAVITGAGSGKQKTSLSPPKKPPPPEHRLTCCNVVVADIKLRPEAESLLSEYSSSGGGGGGSSDGAPRAVFVKTDVSAWEDLRNMLDKAVSEFGSFDILCPGAGVFEPPTSNFWHPPGSDTSRDFVDANHYTALDINLTHPIRATQLALQHWLKPESAGRRQTPDSPPKRVVNVASIAGYTPLFHCPLYAAAKYGVVGFTRSLAHLEAVAGIRVSAVAPGAVSTPMIHEHPEELVDADRDALISPQEVAEAMLSLVESEDHAGGTVLEVGVAYTRTVSVYNDPGPTQELRQGTTLSGMKNIAETITKTLQDGTWQNK